MRKTRTVRGALAATAAALSVTLAATASGAEAPTADATPAPDATSGYTYADFSRLTERSAGQFGSGDSVAGQWSWRTDGPGQYSITWDQERPENRERFSRSEDGEWLLLDGWGIKGTEYYEQRVTSEYAGDAGCANMEPLPSEGGLQHYVRWDIPEEGYCLDARGTITEESGGGAEITFRHRQVWSPPAPCANATFGEQLCITQHETWWDDNGHSYQKVLDREIHLAYGLGMAFTIDQTYPEPWSAELINVWDY